PREAILEIARERRASPVWVLGRELTLAGEALSLPGASSTITVAPGLIGHHQRENAAVAAAMANLSARRLPSGPPDRIACGIARAVWPGRFEQLDVGGRRVFLDCAHNVDGVRALAATAATQLDPARTVLVFGALADKGYASMLRILAPLARAR